MTSVALRKRLMIPENRKVTSHQMSVAGAAPEPAIKTRTDFILEAAPRAETNSSECA